MKNITLIACALAFSAATLKAQSDVNSTVIQGTFQEFGAQAGGRTFTGVDFHAPEATVGSPYLFDKWVKGSVTNINDTVVANPTFLFNYNKMTGALLLTQDMKTYVELDKGTYKAFTLKEASGAEHNFTKVPVINGNTFVETLAKGSRYGIYKLTKTRYKKADYHSDGLTETGDKDNQYIDEFEYYVISYNTKAPQAVKLSFKKKVIKEVFSADAAKVDSYFSQHKDDDLNEDFAKGLVEVLNG
jgi:hypothetical protein